MNLLEVRRFIRIVWMTCIGLPCAFSVEAQLLDIRLKTGRNNFILQERVIVNVTIQNKTDQLAVLANNKNWIQFSVSRARGVPVAKEGQPPEGEVYLLKAGETIEREFQLDPYFDFSEPGEYSLRAVVSIPNWDGEKIVSWPTRIQITRGHDIAILERGVSSSAEGAAPEFRRYTLQKAHVDGKLFLYIRVADNNTPSFRVYSVLPLGTMVQSPRPEIGFEIDAAGIAHVFFQCHARHYLYCTLNPDGKLVARQMFISDSIAGTPSMTRDARGRYGVQGGQRKMSAWDHPAPRRRPRGLPAKELGLPNP